jgi:murein tripeptide amidase MpaA
MQFNRYFTNQEIETLLKEWSEIYPNLVGMASIGKSYEGHPLWLLTLTNLETGSDLDKPAIWIDGNIHATEIAAATTSLYIAYSLLTGYGKDDRITRLLDTSTFYILPRANPDGAALAMAPSPHYLRSGVRPYPWNEKDEGLHPQDIDGDGRIVQMRIEDPTGDWKISSLDARLMEKRAPDEHGGIYYRMLTEGYWKTLMAISSRRPVPSRDWTLTATFPSSGAPKATRGGQDLTQPRSPRLKRW